jgi:hypothetical protein
MRLQIGGRSVDVLETQVGVGAVCLKPMLGLVADLHVPITVRPNLHRSQSLIVPALIRLAAKYVAGCKCVIANGGDDHDITAPIRSNDARQYDGGT